VRIRCLFDSSIPLINSTVKIPPERTGLLTVVIDGILLTNWFHHLANKDFTHNLHTKYPLLVGHMSLYTPGDVITWQGRSLHNAQRTPGPISCVAELVHLALSEI